MTLPVNQLRLVDLVSDEMKRGDHSAFLERFLTGWQEQQDAVVAALVQLPFLLDPFRMPELVGTDGRSTLDYALWRQGFVGEEGTFAALTAAQKRLLIRAAPALWKAKGLPWGWLRLIRLLTGRSVWHADYFHWRHIAEEDVIGETICLDLVDESTPGSEVYGAYESDLYVEDPGPTMRALIADLVDLTRPASERVRVRWPAALEVWDRPAALSGWQRSGSVVLDADSRHVLLDATTAPASAHYLRTGSTFAYYVVQAQVSASAGGILDLNLHWGDDGHWLALRVDWTTGQVHLVRSVSGVEAVLATAAPTGFPAPDVFYELQVQAVRHPVSGTVLEGHIDGECVVSITAAGPISGLAGCTLRQGSAVLGRFMAWIPPLEHSWVAPSGAHDEEE